MLAELGDITVRFFHAMEDEHLGVSRKSNNDKEKFM